MEIVKKYSEQLSAVKAALFDFDGTLSTLRYGWEKVMLPMMTEFICGKTGACENSAINDEVAEYIDQSTGIQTIFQMEWLSERIKTYNNLEKGPDPWELKKEYLSRLMLNVKERREDVSSGRIQASKYHVLNALPFVAGLQKCGVKLYAASGTDDADVKMEAGLLGFAGYFGDIRGAGVHSRDCGKEAVLKELADNLDPKTLAVFGDGKVEIKLGQQIGARTIGVASDEAAGFGVDQMKRTRLISAGADIIIGDFSEAELIYSFLGVK